MRPHGLRGEVAVQPASAGSDLLLQVESVQLQDGRELRVRAARPGPHGPLLAFEGYPDRTAVEPLAGSELLVERSLFPPADPDEFYVDELIGLAVVLPDGRSVGKVADLETSGASAWLVVEHDGRRSLVPFAEKLAQVDKAGGRIVVDAPEGLFDPALWE